MKMATNRVFLAGLLCGVLIPAVLQAQRIQTQSIAGLQSSQPPAKVPTDLSNKEVWMGIRDDNKLGTGTKDDPYLGQAIHYILNGLAMGNSNWAVSTNVTVRLLPGVYGVRHGKNNGANLPDGIRLIGSGMDRTILKLGTADNAQGNFAVLKNTHPVNHVEISDLTVDANWGSPGVIALKTSGVDIRANSGKLERVRCVGFGSAGRAGQNFTHETFSLLWRVGETNRGEIVISECEVEGKSRGGDAGYAACIAVFGQSDIPSKDVPNIRIERNRIRNVVNGAGINLASVGNVLITRNQVMGCTAGVHADTGTVSNVTISNNVFQDVGYGVTIGEHCCNRFQNIEITGNNIEINDTRVADETSRWRGSGVRIAGGVTNVRVEGNSIRLAQHLRGKKRDDLFSVWVWERHRDYPNKDIKIGRNNLDNRLTMKEK